MTEHLTREELLKWHSGAIDQDRETIVAHLAGCGECSSLLASIVRTGLPADDKDAPAPAEEAEEDEEDVSVFRAAGHAAGQSGPVAKVGHAGPARDAGHAGGTRVTPSARAPQVVMPSWQKLAAAAALAIAVGAAGSYLSQRPGAMAVLRGGASRPPTVTTPKDETFAAAELSFEWDRASGSTRIVVVDLSRPDKPVIDRVVEGTRYDPTPDERKAFVSSRPYHWYVEVQDSEGRTQSSPAAQFTVR